MWWWGGGGGVMVMAVAAAAVIVLVVNIHLHFSRISNTIRIIWCKRYVTYIKQQYEKAGV
jgi:hypothetical protein